MEARTNVGAITANIISNNISFKNFHLSLNAWNK